MPTGRHAEIAINVLTNMYHQPVKNNASPPTRILARYHGNGGYMKTMAVLVVENATDIPDAERKIEDWFRIARSHWKRAASFFAMAIMMGLAAAGCATPHSLPADPPLSWGDQGDGTYRNPILPADYSDPDAIRVGNDFYLVASDFHFVGMQVLHSRDLVNWEVIGQVFHRLTMSPKYDAMAGYGQGP
jgi:hypothetical protein